MTRPSLPVPAARAACRLGLRPALRLPPATQRRWLDLLAGLTPLPPGTGVHRERLGGVPVDVVTPRAVSGEGRILCLHGGAYLTGSPRSHRALAAAVAAAAGVEVVVPDYRLAPEHPFPAALDDVLAVLAALPDGLPVAVCGDSAGAGLALAAAAGPVGERLSALALLSPWLDLTREAAWRSRPVQDPVLSRAWLELGARAYAGPHLADPRVSPLPALLHGDLPPLPPVLVVSGAADPLVADADRLVAALSAAGRPVRHLREPGLWHDVPVLAGLLGAADALCAQVGRFLRRHLDEAGAGSPDTPGAHPLG